MKSLRTSLPSEPQMLTAPTTQAGPTPPLSRWLRSQTRGEHLCVESQLDIAGMHSSQQLVALLDGWAHVWRAVHLTAGSVAACRRAGDELLVPAAESLSWLIRDLADLGADPMCADQVDGARQVEGASQDALIELLELPASSWGVAYVLRGSRLGGTVLAPQIQSALRLPPGVGTRFLASSGSEPGREWSAFRHRLDAACLTRTERADAVRAARWTFRWVGASLAAGTLTHATAAQ